ncbi:hypothetical protein [Sanguibacter sp. 25GB23B1]|uniref:hypothetical protein n=1 Tax=unclassified Sanguibacter TaxID=2645534 RepID=UPI0032AEAD09
MPRYVIGPDVALHLVAVEHRVPPGQQLLAPALVRSQALSLLYCAVRRGELTSADAQRRMDGVRGLRLRLLGDRVLQRVAWQIADELDLPDTLTAEYLALTRLQADAFVTLDPDVAEIARRVVAVAPVEDLVG